MAAAIFSRMDGSFRLATLAVLLHRLVVRLLLEMDRRRDGSLSNFMLRFPRRHDRPRVEQLLEDQSRSPHAASAGFATQVLAAYRAAAADVRLPPPADGGGEARSAPAVTLRELDAAGAQAQSRRAPPQRPRVLYTVQQGAFEYCRILQYL